MTAPTQPTTTPPPAVPPGVVVAGAAVATVAAMTAQVALAQQFAQAMARLWMTTVGRSQGRPSQAQIQRFIAQVTPLAAGAQRAMASLVAAQMDSLFPRSGITIPPEAVSGALNLRGVDEQELYDRAFRDIAYALSRGKTLGEALAAGQRRFQSIVTTDLELAKTHAALDYMQRAAENPRWGIVGYRRVLSNNPNHCALCVLASTQRYTVAGLMPIHPGCGCSVMPITGSQDPGLVINEELAKQVHDIVRRDLGESYVDPGGRLGDSHYRDIVITNDHGELGPVLGVRNHKFTRFDSPGWNGPPRLDHRRVNESPANTDSAQPINLDDLE